jgi:phosphatidylserine/phosphatidylglycerophosphate/cardiolipin synthase-like enzyme
LPNLHAKLVLIPNTFASVGSQNMTRRGSLNREATVGLNDPRDIEAAARLASAWLVDRTLITMEMVLDMERGIQPILKAMIAAQIDARVLDEAVWDAEQRRKAERLRLQMAANLRGARAQTLARAIEVLPKSHKQVFAHVKRVAYSRYSLMAPQSASFTSWELGKSIHRLKRTKRYLCCIEDTGKLG